MDEQSIKDLESALGHVTQKIKLWRATHMQLETIRRLGMNASIPMIHEAEKSLAFAERSLCGVTDSLVDEAVKITNVIKAKEPRSMARFAAQRGD